MILDVIVDPVAVGLQQGRSLAVEVGGDSLSGAVESYGAHLDVITQGGVLTLRKSPRGTDFHITYELSQTALNDTQIVVHLERAILGGGVAETVHRPGVGVGEDMGNTPCISQQLHRAVFWLGLVTRCLRTATYRHENQQ